jgi:hypothetical protein
MAEVSLKVPSELGYLDGPESGSDFKAIIDGVDRLSILIKINDRHQKPVQIQQNTQTVMADALVSLWTGCQVDT